MLIIIWLENVKGKKPLVRPRRRWKDSIIQDLRENKVRRCIFDVSGSE